MKKIIANNSSVLPESALSPGWHLLRQGNIYRVTRIIPTNGNIEIEDILTGQSTILDTVTLFSNTASEPCLFAPTLAHLRQEIARQPASMSVIDESGLPEHLLERATTIISVVETIKARIETALDQAIRSGQPMNRTTALKQVLHSPDIFVGKSTYYNYRQLYHQYNGNRVQIAANLRRSTYNQTPMSLAQLHFVDTLIREEYMRPNPVRKRQLYRLAQSILHHTEGHWINPQQCPTGIPAELVANLLNPNIPMTAIRANQDHQPLLTPIQLPSERWFYNYIKHFENQEDEGKSLIIVRYGQEEWERQFAVYDTFIANAAAPLQFVFADHWQLDVITLDEKGKPIRLWLTLLIDGYSRCVLGMALLHEHPCIESMQQALFHAIWPKHVHQQFGTEQEWICYGIPRQLSLDNDWAHHSHSLEDLARTIGSNGQYNTITLVFRPPYRGRYGAIIERLFGNFSSQVQQFLPGAIQSGQPNAYQNALKSACLLYQDLNQFLHQLILRYQHTPHSGLQGMTPHDKWLEGMQLGLPVVPPLTPAMERLFWRMDPQPRQVSRRGICAFGMHYTSLALSRAARVNQQGQKMRYTIRYTPNDISRLAVFHDGRWIGDVYAKQLRLPDGSTRSLSLAEREIAKKMVRQSDQPVQDWLHFTRHWQEIGSIRQEEKKQTPSSTTRNNASVPIPEEDHDDHYTDLLRGFSHG